MSAASHAPAYYMRAAGPGDLEEFKDLRESAGPGFTSLMLTDAGLFERLEHSAQSFAADIAAPGHERYLLALVHRLSGKVVGCCQVKATVGDTPPFYNFRILTVSQASSAAERRFDMDVLVMVNEFTGCTEVGSLFVKPEHRAGGVGRALAQSRYMLMAAAPQRFNDRVVSELRGVVSSDGVSPFWEGLGRHFFRMSFEEADHLSATTDNQFILDLMPKYPIYVDLLPETARAVIGVCHKDGFGARRLLEWEGFRFDNVVDVFDSGPLLSVSRDAVRTAREAKRLRAEIDEAPAGARRGLIAGAAFDGFRCASARVAVEGGAVRAGAETLETIGVAAGEEVLVWAGDAD
jgi:arginine N-succinyltransferase